MKIATKSTKNTKLYFSYHAFSWFSWQTIPVTVNYVFYSMNPAAFQAGGGAEH
jgi:hypothetical protein